MSAESRTPMSRPTVPLFDSGDPDFAEKADRHFSSTPSVPLEPCDDCTHDYCRCRGPRRYRTIVADPPWPFLWVGTPGGRRRRKTELGYPQMTLDELCELPVSDLADEFGCHLFLWATDEMYGEGHAARVRDAWGFKRCAPSLIWRKPNYGMGVFPRPQHEIVMVCRRGPLTFSRSDEGVTSFGSVQDWKQSYDGGKVNSRKPDGFMDMVEQVSPGPYLEMFSRRARFGWDAWGNEVDTEVVLSGL